MNRILSEGGNGMKRNSILSLIAAVCMLLLPAAGFSATEENPYVTPLIAAKTITVGEVRVWDDAENMYVKYVITDPDWCMSETHLAVEKKLSRIPRTPFKKNPIPGLFTYKDEDMGCASEKLYTIPLPLCWRPGTRVYIAAHAVVKKICGYEEPDLVELASNLPQNADMSVTDPYLDGPAYFPSVMVDAEDPLNGDYKGWCISTSIGIDAGVMYNADVYSSYDSSAGGLVDFPENLQKINWILNQDFVGKPTDCSSVLKSYTYGSVQRAIWSLIDDENSDLSLGPYSRCQVAEIVARAEQEGAYFEPECNEYVGVILAPFLNSEPAQPVIIPVPLTCGPLYCPEDETAWGKGCRFTKKGNWGMYFKYVIGKPGNGIPAAAASARQVTPDENRVMSPEGVEFD